MIRYALVCENGDEFDAWFGSSSDFDDQEASGQLLCPHCGDVRVRKAVMAPAIARGSANEKRRAAMQEMARQVREHVRTNFDYVGDRFAEEARRRHETPEEGERPIWGEATAAETKALVDDGIPVAPLPTPMAPEPPRKLN
jgi:hypothetical protein